MTTPPVRWPTVGSAVRWAGRVLTVGALVAASGFGAAGVAAAHVTVHADDAVPGRLTTVTVRAPTESATAATVRLELALPADHPIATAHPVPVPGWAAAVRTEPAATPLDDGTGGASPTAARLVVWTAEAQGVPPGQTGEFRLELGPIPAVDALYLPVVQTYSDGSEQRWIERPAAGGVEPAHPAPVLAVGAGVPAADGPGHGAHTAGGRPGADRDTTTVLGMPGPAVAVGAVVLALLAGAAIGVAPRRRTERPDGR